MTKIVGILNVSPDSFSDGAFYSEEDLKVKIEQLIQDGADMIDVGGESTAPGSSEISESEEASRLKNFFSVLPEYCSQVKFSIDTKKAPIAREAISRGIHCINDVSGGRADPNMYKLLADNLEILYVCMYCKNESGHADLLDENSLSTIDTIKNFFDERISMMLASGMQASQIILDPGMGAFVSTNPEDSLLILQSIPSWKETFCYPFYVCTSRKGFLGKITQDNGPQDRMGSTIATSLYACHVGCDYVRIHDVREFSHALTCWNEL